MKNLNSTKISQNVPTYVPRSIPKYFGFEVNPIGFIAHKLEQVEQRIFKKSSIYTIKLPDFDKLPIFNPTSRDLSRVSLISQYTMVDGLTYDVCHPCDKFLEVWFFDRLIFTIKLPNFDKLPKVYPTSRNLSQE